METTTNKRGEVLVKVKNIDTGVVVWKRKTAYERSMKQWELTTDPLSDEVGPSQEELEAIALKELQEAEAAKEALKAAQALAEKEAKEAEEAAKKANKKK